MNTLPPHLSVPADFTGRVRVFPLPNLVMFPFVMQPLHIFESRYRQLIADAIAGDGLITMALLRPGWESGYAGSPPIDSMACLARIATHVRLPDGRYNLLLQGLHRVCVRKEVRSEGCLYREAEVELARDAVAYDQADRRVEMQRELLSTFRRLARSASDLQELIDFAGHPVLDLGMLTDVVAHSIEAPIATKQKLLSETSVDNRAALLLNHLQDRLRQRHFAERTFPPEFSDN